MANTRSAAKQARAAIVRRDRNRIVKNTIKLIEKKYRKLISAKKMDEAKELLPKVASAYDKAAKRKVIHKNVAHRKNSRLAKLLTPSK